MGYIFVERRDEIDYTYTLGTEFEYKPAELSDIDPATSNYHAFDLVFTKGSNIPPLCHSVQSTIQFYCSSQEGRGSPVLSVIDECNPIFIWNSTYACPKCLDTDINKELGACIDNSRYITYRTSRPCNGVILSPTTEACESLSVGKGTALLAVSIVLIVLLVGLGLALVFFKQKRELQIKYKTLKGDTNLDSDSSDLGIKKEEDIVLDEESLPEGDEEDEKDPI
jgi:hypothetical protein